MQLRAQVIGNPSLVVFINFFFRFLNVLKDRAAADVLLTQAAVLLSSCPHESDFTLLLLPSVDFLQKRFQDLLHRAVTLSFD
jgi:hypothetical protein